MFFTRFRSLILLIGLAGLLFYGACVRKHQASNSSGPVIVEQDPANPWIKTKQRLTLLSANDGRVHLRLNADMKFDTEKITQDSITVVHLGPDHPPIVKTVYGTVPNSIVGSPYIAMTGDGHYGFVPSTGQGYPRSREEARRPNLEVPHLLSVIDLSSPDLTVIQKLEVPLSANMLDIHPDGKHLIVPCINGFRVYEMQAGKLILVRESMGEITPSAFDISPMGDRIIATGSSRPGSALGVHLFSYKEGVIEHLREVKMRPGLPPFDDPFSPRFSPDGKRVLVPNGDGEGTKGRLDDVLSIDLTGDPPMVTEAIPHLADGIEGLAFHPKGHMAVIACLEEIPPSAHNTYSHLAVIDLTSKPARLLYEIDVEAVPEGVEFTPDGSQFFVQLTAANRIAVFDVDRFLLKRSPFVIRVGHAPASMALGQRFMR